MEWKKLVNSSPVAEWKKLGNIMKGKRTTMFVSGFAFALIACTAYMAFSSPGKIMTNPMGRSQTWFPAFLTRSNSSQSVSIFSFIFPNSNSSSSSAKLDDHENTFKGNDDPNNVIAKTPNEENQQTKASHEENQQKEVPKGKRTVPNVQKPDSRNKNGPKRRENQKGSPINNEQTNKSSTQGSAVLPSSPSAIFANKNGSDSFNLTATLSEKNATSANGKGTDLNVTASMVNTTRSEQGNSTSSSEQSTGSFAGRKQCDIFNGRWVRDDSYPYYPAGSCPHIDESFNCFRNRRPENEYEKWRWQPKECNIPRLNATDMLERLRGKRLVFVGDSLNRNMWESLVCILRYAVPNKKRVYEISGRQEFKTEGFYAFRYKDYNCSVEFVRSPFLVQEWEIPDVNGTTKETLRLDIIERSASKYKDANIVVFNTGHWWTHEKTSKGKDYYQEGDHVYSELNVIEAYRKALRTWAKWVDRNINSKKTQVFFRGYSASHFSGGQWNSGGQCHTESQPIFNESYLITYPPKMNVLESVLKEMKTPVVYLNITRMTDYRKDGHPSLYRKQYLSQEERMAPDRYQDCSHWCLPGVPDTWNELLYASLLSRGIGVWRT